jgi:hypothetical protein
VRLTESASVPLSAGVDIGGSKVLAVALDESREVLAQVRLRTGTGAEGVVESAYEDWSHYEGTTVYVGPAFSYQRSDRFWFTVTPTYQLTDNEDEPDFQVRLVASIMF